MVENTKTPVRLAKENKREEAATAPTYPNHLFQNVRKISVLSGSAKPAPVPEPPTEEVSGPLFEAQEDSVPKADTVPAVPEVRALPKKEKVAYLRKTTVYRERQWDKLNWLARKIQQGRTFKDQRFTANTLLRAMLEVFLSVPLETRDINSEAEAVERIRQAIAKK